MVRVKDIEIAVKECKRFIERSEKWMRQTISNETTGEDIYNPMSSMLRASMDASEALVKVRKRQKAGAVSGVVTKGAAHS